MASLVFGTKFHFLSDQVLLRHLPSGFTKLVGHVRYCFNDNYNSDEKDKILHIVNTAKEEDLKQFGVSKKSIISLMKLQKENRALQSLDELKPLFSTKVLDKMFSSFLNKRNLTSTGSAMYPVLNAKQISEFSRVLSFIISGDSVSLCLIHRRNGILTVQSLQVVQYSLKPKAHFIDVLQEIKEVTLQSPACDLCIAEDYPSNNVSSNTFNFQLQMGQTRSMFLAFKSGMPNPPTVIAVKTLAVARVFNTFIGSEKVSGQPVVEKLLVDPSNLKLKPGILDDFTIAEPPTKELLSNVFLLNLSYWKLTNQFKLY